MLARSCALMFCVYLPILMPGMLCMTHLDDDPGKYILMVLAIGILFSIVIMWQAYLIAEKDQEKDGLTRIVPPIIVGAVLFLGVFVTNLHGWADERIELSFLDALENIGKCLLLSAALIAKSYLGPLTLGFTSSYIIYSLVIHGEILTIPLVQSLFEWTFVAAPDWMGVTYVAVVSLYSLLSSLYDSDVIFS